MAKFLVYSSPSRGHLYPLVPTLDVLVERGHDVLVKAVSAEVRNLRERGCEAFPLAASVECAIREDWQFPTPEGALMSLLDHLLERAAAEREDLQRALESHRPDRVLVDVHAFGAMAAAEASGLPWSAWSATLLPFPAAGIPPFGLGLARASGALGAMKYWSQANQVRKDYDYALVRLNVMRRSLGLPEVEHVLDWPKTAPQLLYYTAEPFEYPRPWPASVHLVGPGNWEPEAPPLLWEGDSRPLVLVSCCTEFQDDGSLVAAALEGLAGEALRVVVTTAAIDPENFTVPPNARVVRYAPHTPLVESAACVVCPGGMGLVQKALSAGVPLLAVPFGRDQVEVGQRIESLRAGVVLPAARLSPQAVRDGVKRALRCRSGAQEVAQAFRRCGGAPRAADLLEEGLVPATPA